MAVLTIVVPAYNAAAFLARSIDPLLQIRSGVEVIIVDDGSRDDTAAMADAYAAQHPELVRVVHKPNGGHGSAINTGIAHARGTYLKVLDADDWLNPMALERVLATLRSLEATGGVDALFTDYVHDRVGKPNRACRFDSVFPSGRRFGWDATDRFGARQILMMHAIIYRTELLRRCRLTLPEHTFYVDNLFVVLPLVQVRSMYYLPVTLYHYVIGREGQSVAADVMLARVDQQIAVTRLAVRALPTPAQVASGEVPRALALALMHYVSAVCVVTSATLARGGTREHLAKRQAFWRELREQSPWIHSRLRRSLLGASSNLPGQAGGRVTSLAYHVARRMVGFS